MTYQELATSNQHLYELLEGLTTQISFSIANNSDVNIEHLIIEKDKVMSMINDNLDKIEQIWHLESLKANKTNNDKVQAGPLEKRVIGLYLQLENNQSENIANAVGVKLPTVNRIITTFLNNGYALTA